MYMSLHIYQVPYGAGAGAGAASVELRGCELASQKEKTPIIPGTKHVM